MTYEEWEVEAEKTYGADPIWHLHVYRRSLYLSECAVNDLEILADTRRGTRAAAQLTESLGSIRANLAEGYGRATPADRVRFYEYSLSSARESREWYHEIRSLLPTAVVTDRLRQLSQLIAMLTRLVRAQRQRSQ